MVRRNPNTRRRPRQTRGRMPRPPAGSTLINNTVMRFIPSAAGSITTVFTLDQLVAGIGLPADGYRNFCPTSIKVIFEANFIVAGQNWAPPTVQAFLFNNNLNGNTSPLPASRGILMNLSKTTRISIIIPIQLQQYYATTAGNNVLAIQFVLGNNTNMPPIALNVQTAGIISIPDVEIV